MIVTILGNGPSRERWDGSGDVKIGCHWGDEVDFICTNHHDQGWMPTPTIMGVQKRPQISPNTPIDRASFDWTEDGWAERLQVHELLVAAPKGRYWDTGSIAVIWALHTYPEANIHLWGFDSLWSLRYESSSETTLKDSDWNTWGAQKRWMLYHPRIRVCGRQ